MEMNTNCKEELELLRGNVIEALKKYKFFLENKASQIEQNLKSEHMELVPQAYEEGLQVTKNEEDVKKLNDFFVKRDEMLNYHREFASDKNFTDSCINFFENEEREKKLTRAAENCCGGGS